MSMNINSINGQTYQRFFLSGKEQQQGSTENIAETQTSDKSKLITPEEKIQMANKFWAEHDAEYVKSQAEILGRIGEGMAVAQEISRRMSSGAKVSQSDESNLMQYDMRMYMAAKNAQMMAQRKKDMSDESVIDEYVEKHKNDQKDFVSGELEKVAEMGQYTVVDSNSSEKITTAEVGTPTTVSIDVNI